MLIKSKYEIKKKNKYGVEDEGLRIEKKDRKIKISVRVDDDYPGSDGLLWSSIELTEEEWVKVKKFIDGE